MYVNPANLEKSDGQLLVSYDVIVKNIDSTPHQINLTKSIIRVSKREFPMDCNSFEGNQKEFELKANEQARFVCLAEINKNEFPRSDYESIIEIPLDQDLAKFAYLLRAEDFE